MDELIDSLPRPMPIQPVRLRDRLLGGERSLVCSPLVGSTVESLHLEADRVAALGPDLVEWRADHLQGLDLAMLPGLLARLRAQLSMPLLFTCRLFSEGGAAQMPDDLRLAVLEAAVESGMVDLVDVELAVESAYRDRLILSARERGVPVVLSAHDFRETPEEAILLETLAREQEAGASVAKIATMARTPRDGLRLLSACARARAEFLRIPLVGIAMGPAGAFTRVVGSLFGIDLTFASAVRSSAPGQMDLQDLRQAMRLLAVP